MDKKTTPTHIVIDQDYIQQLPNKMKKPFLLYGNDWQNYLASLPKILRADEGKWEIGQQLTEHVDFEQQGQPISLYGRYGKNIAKCNKCGDEWVWGSGNDCDCPPVAVPLEAPTTQAIKPEMKKLSTFIRDNAVCFVGVGSEYVMRVIGDTTDGDYRTGWIVQLRPLGRDGETLFYLVSELTDHVEPCDFNGNIKPKTL